MPTRPLSVLTIAGSDSGGGAGIQADLKTFAAHGLHGLSALAALTAQHTRGVTAVHVPPLDFLRAQIDACFDDFAIGAVKVASSGAKLLADDALDALRTRLILRATVITPNIPEAELLLGRRIVDGADAETALPALRALGAPAVLLKGGHLGGGEDMIDRLADDHGVLHLHHPRLAIDGHGTGCTLASAIAAGLALGQPLRTAVAHATDYVHGALRHAYRPGKGSVSVLDHFWRRSGQP